MARKIFRTRKKDSLLFRVALLSCIFTLVTLFASAATIYAIQMKDYKAQKVEDIRNIGDYLERLIQEAGEEFIIYQDYYMKHFAEANIPYDFDEYLTAQRKYESLLAAQPAVHDTSKFDFDSFSEEAKMAYFVYIHEYWILTFENARKTFNLPYTYYLVPKEDIYHMVYMIDGERSHKDEEGNKSKWGDYLYLGDEYFDPPDKYEIQWRTWFTGQRQNDFEVWNNEWGHTYAYYTPLIINGKKLGLIGTEIEVAAFNKAILFTSLKISGGIALALIACMIVMMLYINSRYLKKIANLESRMFEFAREKDPAIAKKIQAEAKGRNEISNLSLQFADLILEIEKYVNQLLSAKKELNDTKHLADEMNELAKKDSLTGVRNKTAFDNEVRRLNNEIAEGKKDFGLAMIDLNYLKRINDTYGHQQGSLAIKNLCQIICDIFKRSPVFRVGGDEFVVVLENSDLRNIEMLVGDFNAKIEALSIENGLEPWNKVSAAIGYAIFGGDDKAAADVFSRADKNMYERKKQMKAERKS
ncbi:MAG: diguanylate cyclase [Treponema sp.]|nr:diguanylate cyclase [Treponema sp.]